jgi:hypothetical protein
VFKNFIGARSERVRRCPCLVCATFGWFNGAELPPFNKGEFADGTGVFPVKKFEFIASKFEFIQPK